MKVAFDHVYVSVENMDRAVKFYEFLLGVRCSHREGDDWADFQRGKTGYFGLIHKSIIGKKRVVGNNSTLVFRTDDVDGVFKRVKKHKVKILYPPETLDFTEYFYRCFGCEDTEGNAIEIAQY